MNESQRQTLKLFQENHSVQKIAEKRDLKPTTVHNHLAQLVDEGKLKQEDVSNIVSGKEAYLIYKTFQEVDGDKLSDIKDNVDLDVTYGQVELGRAIMESDAETQSSSGERDTSSSTSYRLLGSFDKTCGDYGGVNKRGTPCGLLAGSKLNRDYGRCQYHVNQKPENRSFLVQWKLKMLRLLQITGMAWLVGSSGSDDSSVMNTIFSLSVVFLIILGVVMSYLQ